MDNLNPFSLAVSLDGYDDPADAIDALFLGEFVAGTYPVSRTVRLPRTRPDAALIPPHTASTRVAYEEGRKCVLAHGGSWVLRANRYADGRATITVIGNDACDRRSGRRGRARSVDPGGHRTRQLLARRTHRRAAHGAAHRYVPVGRDPPQLRTR